MQHETNQMKTYNYISPEVHNQSCLSNWIIVLGMSFILKKFSFKHNHSKNIWDKVWFSCKIVPSWKSSVSIFWQFLASIEKISILALRLALYYHSSKLYLKSFGKSYTPLLLITALLFQLWWKENLVKHQKFPEYHFHDCLKILFWFLSLLTALVVKNSHI